MEEEEGGEGGEQQQQQQLQASAKSNHRLQQVADNQPGDCLKVSQFLAKNNMTAIPHPPYSSDLFPCDIFLFPKLKLWIKGQ